MSRMKKLEDKKQRLKKMYAEERLRPKSSRRRWKKVVAPSQRREMAYWAIAQRSAKIRLACQAFDISQTFYHYNAKLNAETAFDEFGKDFGCFFITPFFLSNNGVYKTRAINYERKRRYSLL